MRIYKSIVIIIICIILCTGCTKGGGSFLDYQNNIKAAEVRWSIGEKEYSGKIDYTPEGVVFTAATPVEIEGTTITYTQTGAEVSVGSVRLSLPDNMGREVYRIARSLSFEKSEMKGAGDGSGSDTAVRFETELYGSVTEYNVIYSDDKIPVSAVIKWDGGEMSVDYISFGE